jgi:hypothetical protein
MVGRVGELHEGRWSVCRDPLSGAGADGSAQVKSGSHVHIVRQPRSPPSNQSELPPKARAM